MTDPARKGQSGGAMPRATPLPAALRVAAEDEIDTDDLLAEQAWRAALVLLDAASAKLREVKASADALAQELAAGV